MIDMVGGDIEFSRLRELARPLERTICETQSLATAAQRLDETGADYIVITDMSYKAIGVITYRDIEYYQWDLPDVWASRRCTWAVEDQPYLSVDDSVDDALRVLKHGKVRPLLISDGPLVVGVVPPIDIF